MFAIPRGRAALGEREWRSTFRRVVIVALLPLSAAAAQKEPVEDGGEPAAVVHDRLTVTDSRLRDRPADSQRVPAHVTVLDREDVAAGPAVNLQQLLAREAGIVLFDATGSDLQQTLDLRGFTGGGVKVYLDGAPLNDPRNNALSLELVSPLGLDRVEIHRGAGSALAGGGAQAGVINLWTRSGEDGRGRLTLAIGSHARADGALAGGGRGAGSDWFGVASLYDADGQRENSRARLDRLTVAAGWQVAGGELRLSIIGGDGDFGNPGALRADELARDRHQAPFNRLDFSSERQGQATLNFERLARPDLSLRANVFARDREREILTTGRAAPAFGGFFLDTGARIAGSAAQLTAAAGRHEVVAGLDWLDGDTGALGFSTPPSDPGRVAGAVPGSDNLTSRRAGAVYLRDRWRPSRRLTVTLAGRWDEDRVGYRETLPDPANADRRTYSELSLRAGASWALGARASLYASYGEAFLPPTVEELFSFPLFGSNPELEPEDARSVEIGLSQIGRRHQTWATLFRIDTRDEIVFDPDSPQGLFGANVNAGETRRRGLELVFRARPRPGLHWLATATVTDAEFVGGPTAGATVPLVPEYRASLGLEAELSPGIDLGVDLLRVGEQVLDNDDANLQPALEPYTVVNARVSWDLAASTAREAAPRLFLAATNLLDEEYSTRGIFAFDFSTFESASFFTPAPGRQLSGGIEWVF